MIWVALRCYNDAWIVEKTLLALKNQTLPHKILVLDNSSSDGSAEICQRYADRFLNIPKGQYIPGRVLNLAMNSVEGDFTIFLNSDCPPVDPDCLRHLLAPFDDPSVGATFGRQMPHPDCFPIFSRDTDETFGDGSRQKYWRHCFSMACSAVRRSVWLERAFREDISYSEDIEFTWAMVNRGHKVAYAPLAAVLHSHNYTVEQYARRQAGEGKADAAIFDWTSWQSSLWRYAMLPCLRNVLKDWKYCWTRRDSVDFWRWLWLAPLYRVRGHWARYRSFKEVL